MIHLTGDMALHMVAGAFSSMQRDEERINALNVFPVPDGDTGTNMLLTVRAAVEAATPGSSLSDVAEQMARGALMGARGNSGTIVSQYFHGFSEGVKGLNEADPFQIAHAFERASKSAYAAVLDAKEGTILTVGRRAAEAAVAHAGRGATITDVITAALQEATIALEETTELLDVLKKAGVVDAGGEGFVIGLQGALAALRGEPASNGKPFPVAAEKVDSVAPLATTVMSPAEACDNPHNRKAIHQTDDITFQYCTDFIIRGVGLPLNEIKQFYEPLGDSLMVVGDEDVIKVHVHTNRPGQVLDIACNYGDLLSVSIENMVEQNRQKSTGKHDTRHNTDEQMIENGVHSNLPVGVGVVAVCSGDGFRDILKSQGVTGFVFGGQSMNPSTGDLLTAIDEIQSDEVILLPNNSNIALTANQVVEMTEKQVTVIPTSNMAEAVSATFDFQPNIPITDMVSQMTEAAESVRVGEITVAVRDASIDTFHIKQGDFLGLIDGDLVATHKQIDELLIDLTSALNPQVGELVTIYAGQGIDDDTLNRHQQKISDLWPIVDVEGYSGGQPVYTYLIAVE